VSAQLHLAENALTLHLFLERLQGLVDIVVTNYDLQVLPLISNKSVDVAKEALQGPRKWRRNSIAQEGCRGVRRLMWPIFRPRRASALP
jgi:hypothetical protein